MELWRGAVLYGVLAGLISLGLDFLRGRFITPRLSKRANHAAGGAVFVVTWLIVATIGLAQGWMEPAMFVAQIVGALLGSFIGYRIMLATARSRGEDV